MQRDPKGRFQKGNGGRPPGSRNRVSRAVAAILEGEASAVTRALVKAAKGGDVHAAIAVVRTIAPAPRDRLIAVDLPRLDGAEDAPAALARLVEAVAAGDITPKEGREVAELIGQWRAAYHLSDLESRIERLETEREHRP